MEEETTTLLTIMPEISRAYSNMTDFMELSGMGKFVVEGVRMGQEFNVNAVPIAMVVGVVSLLFLLGTSFISSGPASQPKHKKSEIPTESVNAAVSYPSTPQKVSPPKERIPKATTELGLMKTPAGRRSTRLMKTKAL